MGPQGKSRRLLPRSRCPGRPLDGSRIQSLHSVAAPVAAQTTRTYPVAEVGCAWSDAVDAARHGIHLGRAAERFIRDVRRSPVALRFLYRSVADHALP